MLSDELCSAHAFQAHDQLRQDFDHGALYDLILLLRVLGYQCLDALDVLGDVHVKQDAVSQMLVNKQSPEVLLDFNGGLVLELHELSLVSLLLH